MAATNNPKSELDSFADMFLDAFYVKGLFADPGSRSSSLANFYRDHSTLIFEGDKILGTKGIVEKLEKLPAMRCTQSTRDIVPGAIDGSVIISVTGHISYDGTDHPQPYCQMFHLVPDGGTWYLHSDIFRFVYG